ncbi:hypothetical protein [Aeromonas jandaei]|uniref:hypothetical protein n=1 Tax=Aeromonas jandaei TaxID=650 RepID=UPI003BA3CEC1
MSLSISEINSQITEPNRIESKDNNTFTLTLNHDGKEKKYIITHNEENRVVSATRLKPGISTWAKFKTVLANFFGTSNNARIVKIMSKMSQDEMQKIINTGIKNKTLKEFDNNAIEHKGALLEQIKKPTNNLILFINGDECDPLGKDKNEANLMYMPITARDQWKDMVPTFLSTKNSAAQVGMIQYGNKEFLRELFYYGKIFPEHVETINTALINSHKDNLTKLAKYINDTIPEGEPTEQDNLRHVLKNISKASINKLIEAGAATYKVLNAY